MKTGEDLAAENPLTFNVPIIVESGTTVVQDQFQQALKHHRRHAYAEAGKIYREILRTDPNHVDAIRNLIDVYAHETRFLEALPLAEALASYYPGDAEVIHRLGLVRGECGNVDAAKKAFHEAASLPGGKDVWKWKHLSFCPQYFDDEEQIDAYWATLNRDLDEALEERPFYDWTTLVRDAFCPSFHLPHLDKCCRGVKEKFSKLFLPSFRFGRPDWKTGRKIRVGFLVTPGHEGGFLRLNSGLIEGLDPKRFEVVLIHHKQTASRYDGKFRRPDLGQLPFSDDFSKAVSQIRKARLDAVYYWKVGADNWSFFLPMCRLAPLQFTSWGTHGTSGSNRIDAYLTWNKAEIPEAADHYTEQPVLFDAYPLYTPLLPDLPAKASRAELKLPEEGAIYFCPHRPSKYHPRLDRLLKRILQRDPTGHIVLLLGKPSLMMKRFIDRMRDVLGEDLFRRMIVLPQLGVTNYYRYLSVSTVILNSPIYSGEITAVDGFLYGVPCVSLTGELLVQRYATAFYDLFGITGPAASSEDDYVYQAVRLGTDAAYREAVSRKIVDNRDRLFENAETVRAWERFLVEKVVEKGSGVN